MTGFFKPYSDISKQIQKRENFLTKVLPLKQNLFYCITQKVYCSPGCSPAEPDSSSTSWTQR